MKYTLLRMTQLILSSMDSDEVNDINDTVESRQVVDVIETTYNDLVSELNLPEWEDFIELTGSGDVAKPTMLTIPEGVLRIDYIQYNMAENGSTVRTVNPVTPLIRSEFFNRMNSLDSAASNVYSYDYLVGSETYNVRGYNDRWPTFYTIIGDHTILFDNFRVDQENTITGNKTVCYGKRIPVFTRSNTFVPDLDAEQFSLLFNEAKSQAFLELKQVQNAKADQRARRALVSVQRTKDKTPQPLEVQKAANFGRQGTNAVRRV